MSTLTTRYKLTKPAGTDPVATTDDVLRTNLDRLDLLLGETGDATIGPSAVDTDTSLRVNYARSYAALAPMVPKVASVFVNENRATSAVNQLWVTGEDATGFTLHIRSSGTVFRSVRWSCRAGG